MAAKIITWDWKEQPDLAELAAAVAEMSGGRVHMREVDTGSDQYEWIISDYEVDDAEAERIDAASSTSAEELADQDDRPCPEGRGTDARLQRWIRDNVPNTAIRDDGQAEVTMTGGEIYSLLLDAVDRFYHHGADDALGRGV
jgi:hypothetical protein